MSNGLNLVQIIGNLGNDPDLRRTQSGIAVLSMSVAVTESWADGQGNKQERTEWIRCSLWGNRGEALQQYLRKGSKVYIQGSFRTSKYQDREGVDRTSVEVTVREIILLGDPRSREGQQRDSGGYGGQRSQGGGGGYGGGRSQQQGGQGQRQPPQQQRAPQGGEAARGAPRHENADTFHGNSSDDRGGYDDDIPF